MRPTGVVVSMFSVTRHVYLPLCWDSQDALANLDKARQRELGTAVRNGLTVRNIYLPTRQGWTPALRDDARQIRTGLHEQVPVLLGKLSQ
jgi:hypothetical protein